MSAGTHARLVASTTLVVAAALAAGCAGTSGVPSGTGGQAVAPSTSTSDRPAAITPAPSASATTSALPSDAAPASHPGLADGRGTARFTLADGWSAVELSDAGVRRLAHEAGDSSAWLADRLRNDVESGATDRYTFLAVAHAPDGAVRGVVTVDEALSGDYSLEQLEQSLGYYKFFGDVETTRMKVALGTALVMKVTDVSVEPSGIVGYGIYGVIASELVIVATFICLAPGVAACLDDADTIMATVSAASTPGDTSVPRGWHRATSRAIGYSFNLPGWSSLVDSNAETQIRGWRDGWEVSRAAGDYAFALAVSWYPGASVSYEVPSPQIVTVDGVPFSVGAAPADPSSSEEYLLAFAHHGGDSWMLEAHRFADRLGSDDRALFDRILGTFQLPPQGFAMPSPQ